MSRARSIPCLDKALYDVEHFTSVYAHEAAHAFGSSVGGASISRMGTRASEGIRSTILSLVTRKMPKRYRECVLPELWIAQLGDDSIADLASFVNAHMKESANHRVRAPQIPPAQHYPSGGSTRPTSVKPFESLSLSGAAFVSRNVLTSAMLRGRAFTAIIRSEMSVRASKRFSSSISMARVKRKRGRRDLSKKMRSSSRMETWKGRDVSSPIVRNHCEA
mmetsp:Transcript_47675/g.132428  ORF Transcript_47675/g.132428 Transcript_47675/m.132428 type:complete len:220 (+) Transcript_47675:207-866(+)